MNTRNGGSVALVKFDPQQVEAAIAHCEREVRRLDAERQRFLLLAATYRQLLQLEQMGSIKTRVPGAKHPTLPSVQPEQTLPLAARFKGMTIAEAAFAVLSQAEGKPMHASAILKAMAEGGRPITSKQASSSLQGTLSNDDRFKHTGEPNTWRLARSEIADLPK
jgi:hypothetical protein